MSHVLKIYILDNVWLQSPLWPIFHWAKWLLADKDCNLSHTWLVPLRPITACPSRSSVRAPAGTLDLCWTSQHFMPNNLPAVLPICQTFDCFVTEYANRKGLGLVSEIPFFFSTIDCEKAKTVFWSFVTQRTDNTHTHSRHLEGTFSSSEEAVWSLWLRIVTAKGKLS